LEVLNNLDEGKARITLAGMHTDGVHRLQEGKLINYYSSSHAYWWKDSDSDAKLSPHQDATSLCTFLLNANQSMWSSTVGLSLLLLPDQMVANKLVSLDLGKVSI
jgi:hypothetical protein